MAQSDFMRLERFAGDLGKAILSLSPKGCEVGAAAAILRPRPLSLS